MDVVLITDEQKNRLKDILKEAQQLLQNKDALVKTASEAKKYYIDFKELEKLVCKK